MRQPLSLLIILALCATAAACRERDRFGTTQAVLARGTLRAGITAQPAAETTAELAFLDGLAARLGARAEPFPAPLLDLTGALEAGVIDLVLVSPLRPDLGPLSVPRGVERLDFNLGGHGASLLVRASEKAFLGLCRRYLLAPSAAPSAPSPHPATARE